MRSPRHEVAMVARTLIPVPVVSDACADRCRQCKGRKIKCGEQKPQCENCEKTAQVCDYSIKLNWDGRTKRKGGVENHMTVNTLRKTSDGGRSSDGAPKNGKPSQHKMPSPQQSNGFNGGHLSSVLNDVDLVATVNIPPAATNTAAPVTQYAKLRDQNHSPYPSPAESNLDGSPLSSAKQSSFNIVPQRFSFSEMPPPRQNSPRHSNSITYIAHGNKRARLSPSIKSPDSIVQHPVGAQGAPLGQAQVISAVTQRVHRISGLQSSSPGIGHVNITPSIPPSPATSSIGSDDSQPCRQRPVSLPQQDRRMSIESLISGSSYAGSNSEGFFGSQVSSSGDSSREVYYGIDPGYPDFDIPFNDDQEALSARVPPLIATPSSMMSPRTNARSKFRGSGSPTNTSASPWSQTPFYKTPIQVKLPKNFEPLPYILLVEPMNLLYFHHFICHTARILVPHDCSGNPFRKILPKSESSSIETTNQSLTDHYVSVALKDNNLLRLLLAYSASHRARLMNYPEPTTRIGRYVENMFSTLCTALRDPQTKICNSTFATAIMLASLEIISPNPFGTTNTISWETHLSMTRKIINERGIRQKMVDRQDEESYFLTRWFAYLDVLGSLSGGQKDLPLFKGDFWANDSDDDGQDHRIDCFFGFTNRCVCILAELAGLAKACDKERATYPSDQAWQPSPQSLEMAQKIRQDFKASFEQPYQGCQHGHRPSTPNDECTTHALELTTTNESYHWAGLIYLNRRVLCKPPTDNEIQMYVSIIVCSLGKLRRGGTAEACMLFPMFIAGCEALDQGHRRKFLDRLQSVEMTGLTQAQTARTLMQRAWEEKRPWEELINGEFIG